MAAIGLSAALLMTACSSGSSSDDAGSATEAADYGTVDVQLSYLKNTEFAGEYYAIENGYFADAGFGDVTLTAGGSSATSAEAQVATGKSLLGITAPTTAAEAILKGAELKIVATEYQKNPFNIVSLKSDPIDTPQDLVGKTIAVSDFNVLTWDAFLAANNIDADSVKTVPYSDADSQLSSGQADGYLGFTTSFTGKIGTKKLAAQQFLLADEGLPMVAESLIASDDMIENHPDEVQAALKAIVQGWQDAIADPEAATTLTVDNYGKDQNFDYDSQLAAIKIQNDLMSTDDTDTNGLLTITDDLISKNIDALALAGIDITADQLFDTSLIDAVYTDDPSLTSLKSDG